jgi:hypothetical protein
LICFENDEVCKRCGSTELATVETLPSSGPAPIPTWLCVARFLITLAVSLVAALVLEFFALLPILGYFGWCLSSKAPPTPQEIHDARLAFIFNMPTVLLWWGVDKMFGDASGFILLTPITQIIFWTVLLIYLWYKIARRLGYR